MKSWFVSIIGTLFFSLQAFGLGGEVGNGGDVIECAGRPMGEPPGLYTLDYLLAPPQAALAAVPLEKIQSLLLRLYPPLGRHLKEFVRLIENTDATEMYVWSANPFGLVDIDDEAVIAILPPECGSGPTKRWQQVVVQQEVGQKRLLTYDSKLFARLRLDPVQYSYLIIHEWLWSMSKSATQVRMANQVFHRHLAGEDATISSLKLVETLSALGLQLPAIEIGDRQTLVYELGNGYAFNFRPLDLKFHSPVGMSPVAYFIEFKNLSGDELKVFALGPTRDPSSITIPPGMTGFKQVEAPSQFTIVNLSRPWIPLALRKISLAQ